MMIPVVILKKISKYSRFDTLKNPFKNLHFQKFGRLKSDKIKCDPKIHMRNDFQIIQCMYKGFNKYSLNSLPI